MDVIKADGTHEPYQEQKVIVAIRRAGIPHQLQQKILDHINAKAYDHIPTSEIYHHILEYLDATSEPFSRAKLGLKQSIMQLGPTGYPFEDFVSELMQTEHYSTQVRQILQGTCVNHEVDIIASKGKEKVLIEAKFHNKSGTKTEIQIPLYVKSRFDDVKTKYHLTQAWVVTNTKATSDAIAYALCVNMKLISWSYPEGGSLRELVEDANLHPVTILTSLSQDQKTALLNNHIVLCKDIQQNPDLLQILHLSLEQAEQARLEVRSICSI